MKICPKCGSKNVIIFDSDNDLCKDCDEWFPAVAEFDFELESTPLTLCGRLGQKHRMKRMGPMKTVCIYPGCDGYC